MAESYLIMFGNTGCQVTFFWDIICTPNLCIQYNTTAWHDAGYPI